MTMTLTEVEEKINYLKGYCDALRTGQERNDRKIKLLEQLVGEYMTKKGKE